MLLDLSLKDFVLVSQTELSLARGFTALTGETGAGKSILLDALGFLLGGRADASLVRHGCDKAEVSASFLASPAATAWLLEHDYDTSGELQLRRTLDNTGRNRCFINGSSSTATQLRELGEYLVDIHGQHEHQLLLKPSSQRQLLDDYAHNSAERAAASTAWHTLAQCEQQLNAAQTQADVLNTQREQLAWIADELTSANPIAGEWASLEEEHKRLSHSSQLIETLQSVLAGLEESDDALTERTRSLHHSVQQLERYDPATAALAEPLETAHIHLQEAARNVAQYLKKTDLDPERLATVEQRISLLHSTARKLKLAPADLAQRAVSVQAELAALNNAQNIPALLAAKDAALAAFNQAATQLSSTRNVAAQALSGAVTNAMQALALNGGQFEASLRPAPPSAQWLPHVCSD